MFVIHAIGDASATMIIDAVERAEEVCGNKGARFAIEHTDNLKLEDIARMKRLGINAAVQPQHPHRRPWGRACTRSLLAKSA